MVEMFDLELNVCKHLHYDQILDSQTAGLIKYHETPCSQQCLWGLDPSKPE